MTHLRDLAVRLSALDLRPTLAACMEQAAEDIAGTVRESLSHPPGDEHRFPWLRTGALHDSIATEADAAGAVIGSISPVALYQEHGAPGLPPRPFLAPAATGQAAPIAGKIADAICNAVRRA